MTTVDQDGLPRLAVTTSGKASAELIAHARQAAEKWRLPFIARKRKAPIGPLLGREADAFLVFGIEGLTLRDRDGALRFTPGMARLRVKRLDAGIQEDVLVRIAGFRAGESVLDCTLGLGADALVAARAVGPSGRVVGLEKSLALYALVSDGLEHYQAGHQCCRIEPLHADGESYLLAQSDGSFDHVLFDPMFERPRRSAPSFEILRRFADYSPLTVSTLRQAARVARRTVVVKAARHWNGFARLGLSAEPGSRYSPVLWARLAGDALQQARTALTCPTCRPESTNPPGHHPVEER